MNPTTYTLSGITNEDCDLIAAALDFYLCNAEIPDEHKEPLTDWLVEFDLMADPEIMHEIANETNPLPNSPKVTAISGNLISVDFANKNI